MVRASSGAKASARLCPAKAPPPLLGQPHLRGFEPEGSWAWTADAPRHILAVYVCQQVGA